MSVDAWDEIRTAFHVARLGTVSGAAEALGVHHATVIRHVDALEARLGAKLFQRHARGYTPTEAGQDLLQVASATEDQFTQLVGRIRGRGAEVSGELILTALPGLSPRLVPILAAFMDQYPQTEVRFLTDVRLFRLEYGEAHVAIRAGTKPDQPDNIVQPFCTEPMAAYAARGYLAAHGAVNPGQWQGHRFVGTDDAEHRAPFFRWMRENIPVGCIAFRTGEDRAAQDAIEAGIGIGFLPVGFGDDHPDLVQVLPPQQDWATPLWLVTHVDLHRTAKVQALLRVLKAHAQDGPPC